MIAKHISALHFGFAWAGVSFVTISPEGWLAFLCGWVLGNWLAMLVWAGFGRMMEGCDSWHDKDMYNSDSSVLRLCHSRM